MLHSSDITLFSKALSADIGLLKNALGDAAPEAAGEEVIV